MAEIRLVIADDHVLVRKGIVTMLESEDDLQVIGEADNGLEALQKAAELKPDVMILDIRMPEMNGLEAAAKLKDYSPGTKVIMLTMHESDEYVWQALDAGAYGYLLKDTDKKEFLKAIHQVYEGNKYYSGAVSNALTNRITGSAARPTMTEPAQPVNDYGLTKREKQILKLVIEGQQNKQIADQLQKSIRTIETHRFNIMKKLNVNNAIDMVNKATREGVV